MNRNIIMNIIKSVMLIIVIIIILSHHYDYLFPFSFLGLIPIAAYVMNKFTKKNKRKFNLYNFITLFLTIISVIFISYLLSFFIAWFSHNLLIESAGGYSMFLSLLMIVLLLIDIIMNIKTYKNNLIIPVCLFIYIIRIRNSVDYYIASFDHEYYISINFIIFMVILFLTLINGNIELKRMKLKKEA